MTQVTFEELQEALVEEIITVPEMVQILVDNFGMERAYEMMKPIFDEALQ